MITRSCDAYTNLVLMDVKPMLVHMLHRYPQAFGSDDRMHACMSELGVALTKEPGFHQVSISFVYRAP
jgi:hypothetical protein